MKRYGNFDSLDELLAYNMPFMKEDRKERAKRRIARGMEGEIGLDKEKDPERKSRKEQLCSLLYVMENMSSEELDNLINQYDEELKEKREKREKEAQDAEKEGK